MIDFQAALLYCNNERRPGATSCVDALAAAVPPDSELRAAYETFLEMTPGERRRGLNSPLASARLVACKLKCAACAPSGDGPAWGVVDGGDGRQCFAFRHRGLWWARSELGIARVADFRVLRAWEIK